MEQEKQTNTSNLIWERHLHPQVLKVIGNNLEQELSGTDTVVLVGDVRNSQVLMTYSQSVAFFRDKMFGYVAQVMKIIKSNYGIFDKFIGDGFVSHFNSTVCEKFGKDYYRQMLKAAQEIMDFSIPFFDEWGKQIRKLPPIQPGIALGVDCGIVEFRNLDNYLVSIGEPIVWASRVSNAGQKGEIIFNNMPYHKVRELIDESHFEPVESATKGGENFTAYKLKLPIWI